MLSRHINIYYLPVYLRPYLAFFFHRWLVRFSRLGYFLGYCLRILKFSERSRQASWRIVVQNHRYFSYFNLSFGARVIFVLLLLSTCLWLGFASTSYFLFDKRISFLQKDIATLKLAHHMERDTVEGYIKRIGETIAQKDRLYQSGPKLSEAAAARFEGLRHQQSTILSQIQQHQKVPETTLKEILTRYSTNFSQPDLLGFYHQREALLRENINIRNNRDILLEKQSVVLANIVRTLQQEVRDRIVRIHHLLGITGLPLENVNGYSPNPFEQGRSFENLQQINQLSYEKNLETLQDQAQHWIFLEHLLRHVPLSTPVIPIAVSSPYATRIDPFTGIKHRHDGVDLPNPAGTKVRAPAGGIITIAGKLGGYGNLIEIDHGYGIKTRYGHLEEISVEPGTIVNAGTVVGLVGSTGRSTGPHLHYEVRFHNEPIDPGLFMGAGFYAFTVR